MITAFLKNTADSGTGLSALLLSAWLTFIFVGPGTLMAGDFYRWVDEKGVVHVSDTFPPFLLNDDKQNVRRINVPVNVPASGGSQRDEYQIPFSRTPSGGIIVKGIFDDSINVTLLFDTGASHMVISETLAKQLNSSYQVTRKVKVQTAGGPIDAGTAVIAKVALGDASKENVAAVVTERETRSQGFDAILGLSFLQDFKATVDYPNKMIILKRH